MRRCLHPLIALLATVTALLSLPAAVEAADRAAIDRSVAKAAAYLRGIQAKQSEGRLALCTYALMKAGGKPTDAGNAAAIAGILERCKGDSYQPISGSDSIYAAGIEAMILVDADPERYQPQLQKVATYLLGQQRDDGAFSYRGPQSNGDISVTQYGALGLWACARAGIRIPAEAWDKLAQWHMKSQVAEGGFQYVPGESTGLTSSEPNLSMTAAAASTMTIAAMYLYPAQSSIQDRPREPAVSTSPTPPKNPNDPLGVLTIRRPDSQNSPDVPSGPYKPQASFGDIQQHIRGAVGWATRNFTTQYRKDVRMYNYYTLERMGALAEIDKLGSHDWYDECSTAVLQIQQPDGSWTTSRYDAANSYAVGTSLAVLFLTRSTAKLINRQPPEDAIGGGIQVGGRGLPEDLSTVKLQGGRVESVESTGPLDDLLKSLETADVDNLFDVQGQIVKKIQLGDRTELIGQTQRLIELIDHPSPGIRRTALWALARSDDLTVARHLVAALEDPDADVLMEAHNALCWLSRRPNAFDIPASPIAHLPPDATEQQKEAAVEQWRRNALVKWGNWYFQSCPYEERNTPFALDLARKIGAR